MRSSATTILFLLAAACEAAPATSLQSPNDPPIDPPIKTTTQTLADCTPKELWRTDTTSYGWIPAAPQFSPNGGLVTRGSAIYFGGTSYFRVTDGQLAANVDQDFLGRDRGWDIGVRIDRSNPELQELKVETLFEGSVLFHQPYRFEMRHASLSKDGALLAVLMCDQETNAATLDIFRMLNGEKTQSIALDDACHDFWDESTARLLPIDDVRMLVATNEKLHRVDLSNGDVVRSASLPQIISFGIDEASGALAVVTNEPKLHFLSPELATLDAPAIDVPIVELNRNLYAPLVLASPVAWSPDGVLFAHLDAEQNLVLEKDGAEHARIPPMDAHPPWDENEMISDPAATASFSPDGKLLAVSFEHGFELWGCEAVAPVARPQISVRIDGPAQTKVGETVHVRATDLDGRDFHGHQFLVDGTAAGLPSEKRDFDWIADTAGVHEISVHLDDGLRTGDAALKITVE